MERFAHLIEVRFAPAEWRLLSDMALLRQVTVEDLVRDQVGLPPFDELRPARGRRHLQAVPAAVDPRYLVR